MGSEADGMTYRSTRASVEIGTAFTSPLAERRKNRVKRDCMDKKSIFKAGEWASSANLDGPFRHGIDLQTPGLRRRRRKRRRSKKGRGGNFRRGVHSGEELGFTCERGLYAIRAMCTATRAHGLY
jgi:hypothetical protein